MKDSISRVIRDGAVAGLVGATAIMVWMAIVAESADNLAQFSTVFGSAYLPVHFAAFAAIGAFGALILCEGEWDTALLPPVAIFVAGLTIFLVTVVTVLGPARSVALPWWNAIIGDLVALAAIFVFLFARHRQLARDLREAWRGVIGGKVKVICPQTHDLVVIRMDAERGTIQTCSRWPACYSCARNCAGTIARSGARAA